MMELASGPQGRSLHRRPDPMELTAGPQGRNPHRRPGLMELGERRGGRLLALVAQRNLRSMMQLPPPPPPQAAFATDLVLAHPRLQQAWERLQGQRSTCNP